jgi:Arc/MetJ family transcription regulator
MGETVTDVDEPILEEAQRLLGTSSSRDTVNVALRELVRRRMAEKFFDDMSRREPGELEELRAAAWR